MNQSAQHPEDSLDRDLTRAGDVGEKPRADSSLGDLATGADLGQSRSDLSEFAGEI